MLSVLFDVLVYTIPEATGRAVVYVVTLGRVQCEDGMAETVGVVFLAVVFLVITVVLLRP